MITETVWVITCSLFNVADKKRHICLIPGSPGSSKKSMRDYAERVNGQPWKELYRQGYRCQRAEITVEEKAK